MKPEYSFDNAWVQARERLRRLEAACDPGTIRHLLQLGVAPGWHCLEVGAEAGSMAAWLCRQVGLTGQVLATDLDTRFLDTLDYPNLEVRHHDLTAEALPENAFDLVHSRLVLMHLPGRESVLPTLIGALRPGGWLLIEEAGSPIFLADSRFSGAALFERGKSAFLQVQTAADVDWMYGPGSTAMSAPRASATCSGRAGCR